jgi:hypothetical protein
MLRGVSLLFRWQSMLVGTLFNYTTNQFHSLIRKAIFIKNEAYTQT